MAGINFDAVKDNDKVTNYNFVSDNEKEGTIDKVEEKNFFDWVYFSSRYIKKWQFSVD